VALVSEERERRPSAAQGIDLMDVLVSAPGQATELAATAPDVAERLLTEAADHAPAAAAPLLDSANLAAAAVSFDGRILAATPAFLAEAEPTILEPDAIAQAARACVALVRAVSIKHDGVLRPGLVAYGSSQAARVWQLPEPLRAALAEPGAVAIIVSMAPRGAPLARAAYSFGLTGLQARVCSAIVATGDVRSAAERCGVSYATAREAVAGAMVRMGVRKLPHLVTELARLAYGVLPAG
jgi:hypothetical protein